MTKNNFLYLIQQMKHFLKNWLFLQARYAHFQIVIACRVYHMTSWLKSNRRNSAVRLRSMREVLRVTWSTQFSDKGSVSELSKPAGCSESELRCSLVSEELELPTLWLLEEGKNTCPNENCQNRQVDSRGIRGDTQGRPYEVAREALADAAQDSNGWI